MIVVIKFLLSGALLAVASELGKRSGKLGGLILSLPLTSILALTWLWWETRDGEKVAEMTTETFWFILPSLPLFFLLPPLLRRGVPFPWAMALCVIFTLGTYALFYRVRV
jgi:hypothetical protein